MVARLAAIIVAVSSMLVGVSSSIDAAQPVRTSATPHAAVVGLPATPAFDGNPCSVPARDDPTCPVWNRCSHLSSCTGDAPDPALIKAGSSYVVLSTGTALGNSIQVLVSDRIDGGYHAWPMGQCPTGSGPVACRLRYGSSAFGIDGRQGLPGWTVPGTQMAPSAAFVGGRWVMYFAGVSTTTGRSCLGVAELDPRYRGSGRAISLPSDPSSPPLFVAPGSSPGPLRCEPPKRYGTAVGLVDPSVFVNPGDGTPWLLYKTNDGSSPLPAHLLVQQLTPDGLHLTGPAHLLLSQDTRVFPWQQTIENPEMVIASGGFHLLFSAGLWDTAGYGEAEAACLGPAGPCWPPSARFLTSTATAAGPGGASVLRVAGALAMAVAAWSPSCIGYPGHGSPSGCTTGARRLFVGPLAIG